MLSENMVQLMCGGNNICSERRPRVSFLLVLQELKSVSLKELHYAEMNVKSTRAPPSEVGIQSHLTRLALSSVQRL